MIVVPISAASGGHVAARIFGSIKKVTVVVQEIANASAEQSTGIEEINEALTQMDELTQQKSALIEENAATAKTLSIRPWRWMTVLRRSSFATVAALRNKPRLLR